MTMRYEIGADVICKKRKVLSSTSFTPSVVLKNEIQKKTKIILHLEPMWYRSLHVGLVGTRRPGFKLPPAQKSMLGDHSTVTSLAVGWD